MIVEWLSQSGNTARYDTAFNRISYIDPNREVVEPVRPATSDETAEYLSQFPETSQERTTAINDVAASLYSVLLGLRAATQDRVVTDAEFAELNPQIVTALTQYSNFEYSDEYVNKLAFLVVTQIVFAYSALLQAGKVSSGNLASYVISINNKVLALEAEVANLKAAA
jgi:hypothetical protein